MTDGKDNWQGEVIRDKVQTNTAPCFLCKQPSTFSCVFVPEGETARAMNVPINKKRHILYTLCEKCFSLPNKADLAEEKLLVEYRSAPHTMLGDPPIYQHEVN